MKAEERKELETNSLIEGFQTVVDRAKAGRLVNPYVAAVVLAVVLGGGLWWYLASEGRKLRSHQWTSLTNLAARNSETDLDAFVKDNKDSTAARTARLDVARLQLGPEGIGKLNSRDRADRNKAIESIGKARESLRALADEFKGDPTMRATCLLATAEAELALVGVPKDAAGESQGSVDRAVELYRQTAEIVGGKSQAAEQFRKRADELAAKKEELVRIGGELNRTAPSSFEGPKAPTGPIPPINSIPPAAPGDAPKPPTTITPPAPPAGPPPSAPPVPTTPPGTPAAPAAAPPVSPPANPPMNPATPPKSPTPPAPPPATPATKK